MATWTPDPTFYPSARLAARAPVEKLAYVAEFEPGRRRPDRLAVVDVDSASATYARIVGRVEMPMPGDELHHFGWNACSSSLCPNAPHPHLERRYLIVPGLRSSRIHILDTKPDPKQPKIVKVIEPSELADRAGYSRPHTVHCGPEGIYVSALGNAEGKGPGGVFLMDHETFEVRGRGRSTAAAALRLRLVWHLGYDTAVTSEWGTPDMFEDGLVPELLLGAKYGRRLHFWDLTRRRHVQEIDFGAEHQLIFELRPPTIRPKRTASSTAWSASRICPPPSGVASRRRRRWAVTKVIDIPAEPTDPTSCRRP
jgi:selenium-binding protein 1